MTLTVVGYAVAVTILVAGTVVAMRIDDRRRRAIVMAATVIVAVVVGWFSWLAGTSA